MRVRAHVRLVATVWLTCQVAAFAASPFVLCHDHGGMTQTADGHECSPTHHHRGQQPAAPASHEHHHSTAASTDTRDSGASLNCRCTVSDAALAALILEAGVLPGAFVLDANAAPARVVLADYAAPTRSHIPDVPPPRA